MIWRMLNQHISKAILKELLKEGGNKSQIGSCDNISALLWFRGGSRWEAIEL